MARKDVDVRVRAHTKQATRDARSFSNALSDMARDGEKARGANSKLGSAFAEMAADVAKLEGELKGLGALSRVVGDLDRLRDAAQRSDVALGRSAANLNALRSRSDEAARTTSEYRAQLAAQERAQTSANEDLKVANRALAENKKAIDAAQRALRNYNKETYSLGGKRQGPPQLNQDQIDRGVVLTNALSDVQARRRQLEQAVKALKGTTKETSASVSELRVKLREAAAEQKVLERETTKAGNAMLSLRTDTAQMNQKLSEAEAKATSASDDLGKIALTQEEIARASERARIALDREAETLEIFNRLSRQKLRGGGTIADPTQNERSVALDEARRKVDLLREAQAKLDAQVAATSGNATVQVDAYNRMTRAIGLAEQQIRKLEIQQRRAAGERAAGLASNGFGAWIANQARASNEATTKLDRLSAASARTTAAVGRIAPAAQRASGGIRNMNTEATRSSAALNRSANASRNALSFYQRLRSEVIALAAGYVGLNATLEQGRRAIGAYQTLEAAQSRLGAVMSQDTAAVAQEIDFLRAQADRLGISFETLSNEYGKFTVAARASNYTMAETRQVFLAVAEAGRVNKLSMDQMSGIFLALQQMISKGRVTAEELNRQLGDRLPGAAHIFANALGVTTAELADMMRAGDVLATSSTMVAFAEELTRRFGSQLPTSLETFTTELGRSENSVFNIALTIAQGFIPALQEALQLFNEFAASADGAQLFASIGSAASGAIQVFTVLAQNLDLLAYAAGAFVAVKLGNYFVSLASTVGNVSTRFRNMREATQLITTSAQRGIIAQTALGRAFLTTVARLDLYRARMVATAAASTRGAFAFRAAAQALGVMRTVMLTTATAARVMWSAIGGLPGLIATGIVVALTQWFTGVDQATSAMVEHERQVEAVRQAYQLAEGDVDRWAAGIRNVTLAEAERNLATMRQSLRYGIDDLLSSANGVREVFQRLNNIEFRNGQSENFISGLTRLNELLDELDSGEVTVQDFRTALDELYRSNSDSRIREAAQNLLEMTTQSEDGERSLVGLEGAAEEAAAVVALLGDNASGAAEEVLGLGESGQRATESLNARALANYNSALSELREAVPEIKREMELLARVTQLNETAMRGFVAAFQTGGLSEILTALANGNLGAALGRASGLAGRIGQRIGAVGGAYSDARRAADIEFFGSAGAAMAAQFLRDLEGFRPEPYWDVNALRAGYGSDTFTRPDGTFGRIAEGMTITLADAERDLARRINEFRETVISEIGSDRFNALSANQQGVLTSIAYNYGSLRGTGELNTFRNGSIEEMVAAIRRLASHNDGINAGRRNQEADAFSGDGATYRFEQQAYELDVERQRLLTERTAQTEHQIQQQALINAHREREAAITDAIFQAEQEAIRTRGEGATLSEQELATIREQAAALWDAQNPRYEIERSEERINQLLAVRQEIMSQLEMAQERGDAGAIADLRAQLTDVNARIQEVIPNAIAMWEAIGGVEAEAAIARLRSAQAQIQATSNQMGWFGLSVQTWNGIFDSALNGLMGAFDAMSSAIANGENAFRAFGTAVLQTLAQVLQQIGVTILRMLILKALSGLGGPIGGWATGALGGMTGHTGGLVGPSAIGSGNRIGRAPQWVSAIYHTGGVAGLAPDEVNATLRVGEEVITEQDERHRFNQGGEAPADKSSRLSQILAIGEKQVADALRGRDGKDMVVTHIKTNAPTIRRILGV